MSPMEQLAKQEYERGYSDGKSDFFAAGVAEGEMRARQRMIANRVAANQHPFAASGKPIDHVAASGKMIAEPVKQEPVAHYKDAPHTIYLQTGCDDPEDCECSFNEWGDTTWCADQIHDTDIPYIRADYAAPLQQADLTVSDLDAIIEKHYDDEIDLKAMILDGIAAFKEKNK